MVAVLGHLDVVPEGEGWHHPPYGAEIINWCLEHCESLRADTHADNKIMQHILEKNGFTKCGIIPRSVVSKPSSWQRVSASVTAGRQAADQVGARRRGGQCGARPCGGGADRPGVHFPARS